MKAILFNSQDNRWVLYQNPIDRLEAHAINEVIPVLNKAEEYTKQGYHCVGFCSYESAAAFDMMMHTHSQKKIPCCFFAVYTGYQAIDLPQIIADKSHSSACKKIHWQSSISERQYQQDIEKIKTHLLNGDCYQINYTYRLKGSFSGDAFAYFLNLIPQQQTQLGAYLESDDWAICSASPELFFQLDDKSLHSRPMKGTAPRGQSPEEDRKNTLWLEQSEKNKAENTMIVDMIRNDLGRIAEKGSVKVESLHTIEQYATALQMTSTVSAITNRSVVDIFQAMFPCASITGAPKVKSMEIIHNLEQEPRHIYTGSIGYLLPNRQAKFNVAIRTVYIDKRNCEAEFGLGGGIVWDSTGKEEYQESLIKARLLFSM